MTRVLEVWDGEWIVLGPPRAIVHRVTGGFCCWTCNSRDCEHVPAVEAYVEQKQQKVSDEANADRMETRT